MHTKSRAAKRSVRCLAYGLGLWALCGCGGDAASPGAMPASEPAPASGAPQPGTAAAMDQQPAAAGSMSAPGGSAAGSGSGSGVGPIRGTMSEGQNGMPAAPICTSCGDCAQELPVESRTHIAGPIEYPDPPPAGGDHDQCWATWGVHMEPVPARNWVHNLEHGGVVFLYNCPSGCPEEQAQLTELARANPRTVVTSYADMPKRFALVSWGARIQSECYDGVAFQAFYDAHFDAAPEAIASEPPASCPRIP